MGRVHKVAVIIPAYNEAAVIGKTLRELLKQKALEGLSLKIIVVNDGSSDNTAQKAKLPGVQIVNHVLNSGSGAATATGLQYAYKAGYTVAATIDADGQHDVRDLMRGINLLINKKVDLLIGSRLLESKATMPRIKLVGNKLLSLITYCCFGVAVTDSQSGLRIFSQKALQELSWETSGYEYCSEMLWRAKKLRLKISEYPIKAIYTTYSASKGQSNWNGINIVKALLKTRLAEFL